MVRAELDHCKGRTEQKEGYGRTQSGDSEAPYLGDWKAEADVNRDGGVGARNGERPAVRMKGKEQRLTYTRCPCK